MEQTTLATEARMPGLEGFDSWDSGRILETLLAGQRRGLDAVAGALPRIAAAAEAIAPRLAAGGRLIYAGAGTSIRVAVQDGSELHSTFGMDENQVVYLIAGGREAMFETRAGAEDDVAQAQKDAAICVPGDCVIAAAASGRTPYTVAVAKTAQAKGALVVAIVNNPGSALAAAAHIEIFLDSGPEVIAGSTRLAAGTAQKAALNLLSTLVHVRLGAVHDGLMVNVSTGNSKLAKRAARIVSTVSGAPQAEAEGALEAASGRVKIAVLLLKGVPSAEEAERRLAHHQGSLRMALEAIG